MKDFWNTRYAEYDSVYGTSPNDFLRDQVHCLPQQGKILCLAEGEGRNALFLAQNGFIVTAVDFSEKAIEKLQRRSKELNLSIQTVVADLNDFEMGSSEWDGIVSIFGHLPPRTRKIVHGKIVRALKPEGVFLMEAYCPEQLLLKTGGPKEEDMFMTLDIINEELSDLKPQIKRTCIREINEGLFHNGLSAVVQFIGSKSLN
ncbi:MAG: class I SAM-dependent methyltransferase [Bacteriovoracia bacterium]